jgi:DNA-binding PadR family transcriptional regulator
MDCMVLTSRTWRIAIGINNTRKQGNMRLYKVGPNAPARSDAFEGVFGTCVSKIVRQLGPISASDVAWAWIETMDQPVDPSQIFIALKRLAQQGRLKAAEGQNTETGRAATFYSITDDGTAALARTEDMLARADDPKRRVTPGATPTRKRARPRR